MVFQKLAFGLILTAFSNFGISQNNSNIVPNNGTTGGIVVSSPDMKGEARWQRIEKLLATNPSIEQVTVVESISELNAVLTREELNIQNKYASLLDINPAALSNIVLFESIDEWYGTRYVYGGTTKRGVDCSAFVRAALKDAYGFQLPRTAREQYQASRRISTTELKEGDLVFFNTRGGVSHVGVYLRNNKFVHASSSKGVIISDLYENYYMNRYIGAGRVEQPNVMAKNY